MASTSELLEDVANPCNVGKDHEAATHLEVNDAHRASDGMSNDFILEPKHKIFISHSKAQKEFVEHLCLALERRGHHPFFDKRPTSLPKGQKYPPLIFEAAQQCLVAIVVVSEEYFMSKWPMIELQVFVEVTKKNSKLSILPLFYRLSAREVVDKRNQERWFNQWEIFSKNDAKGRIKVNEWQDALHKKWDDSHVQGKVGIFEVIYKKIKQVGPSQRYKAHVGGIYGVAGIGKTTVCKILCNEFSNDYEGRVYNVEIASKKRSLEESLRMVLINLTSASLENVQLLDEGQCEHVLKQRISKQRSFLAIDNVSEDSQSIKQAKMYLEAPFHKDSLVIVTARSLCTLESLGIAADACLEMPELGEADAMKLFLHHAAHEKQFGKEDEQDILECVRRCYFKKGYKEGSHYHPLALEALGLQLGFLSQKPSEWVKNLPKVRNFDFLLGENPVFSILKSSFDLLSHDDQSLSMDVIFYCITLNHSSKKNKGRELMEWLCLVYKQDEDRMKFQLDRLKGRGLLLDVDLTSGRVSMHDLYREFAELELMAKFDNETNFQNQKWVHVKNRDYLLDLESTLGGGCLPKLIRVAIHQSLESPLDNPIESLEAVEWKHCSNVVVLKVIGLPGISGTLDLKELKFLRSLELHDVVGLDSLEGLKGLKNLVYFKWRCYKYKASKLDEKDRDCYTCVDQFPASLKVLQIKGGVLFGPEVLVQCKNLRTLVLHGICADSLDLSHCSSLESVKLKKVRKVKILSGLTARWASKLQSLKIWRCEDLVYILGLGRLIGLEELLLEHCSNIKLPNLQNLTKLLVLRLTGRREVESMVPSLGIAHEEHHQLQWKPMEVPKLNGFKWLQVLDLSWNSLASLEGLEDLPALRCLDLSHCRIQSQLPNMSKYKSLEELKLVSSEIELHEEDIGMLASLPLLQPVPIGGSCVNIARCRLDLVRRKVLNYRSNFGYGTPDSWLHWKKHGWIESFPFVPPITIQKWTDLTTRKSLPQSLRDVHFLESFHNFFNLQVLCLNRCEFHQSLPSSFYTLTKLEILTLRETAFEALPDDFGQLCSLKEVDFSSCKSLLHLPKSFGNLSNLEKLWLNGCELFYELPSSFCRLTKLEILWLAQTPLRELPHDFGQLCSLREVDFGGCKSLTYLPESFGNLSKLQKLWLNGCELLYKLPSSFCRLTKLEILRLAETALEELPNYFGQLCSLKEADFGGCKRLTYLPKSFANLFKLKKLYLNGFVQLLVQRSLFGAPSKLEVLTLRETPLSTLLIDFGQLSSLKEVDFGGCKSLTYLSESFGNLSKLEKLWLNGCELLYKLPSSFCRLTKLEILRLAKTALRELQDDFGQLCSLREADFGGCKSLTYLPKSFGNLSKLENLWLNGCKFLCKLPSSFCRLTKLEILRLAKTALRELPDDFGQLCTLREADFGGCKSLKYLSESFGNLSKLENLWLNGCKLLYKLPSSFCRLTKLEILRLAETALQELPDDFDQLCSLREADFGGCKSLAYLPKSFGNLSKLEKLWLNECILLWRLPSSFGALTKLEVLELAKMTLMKLPHNFGQLSRVKEVDFSDCKSLLDLPESFGNLSKLEKLCLNGCKLLYLLPSFFSEFTKLEILRLAETALQELPHDFGQLCSLREADFGGCKNLTYLPESFGNLSKLQKLWLNGCEFLYKLPSSFCRLTKLEILWLAKTALQELPHDFGQLCSLREADFGGCKSLAYLPESFGNLSKLEKLWLNGCELLYKLPSSFCRLTKLEILRLAKTALRELPDDFGQLCTLREADFGGCKSLTYLPESFGNLSKLEKLWLNGCEFLYKLPSSFCRLTKLEVVMLGKTPLKELPANYGQLSSLREVDFGG